MYRSPPPRVRLIKLACCFASCQSLVLRLGYVLGLSPLLLSLAVVTAVVFHCSLDADCHVMKDHGIPRGAEACVMRLTGKSAVLQQCPTCQGGHSVQTSILCPRSRITVVYKHIAAIFFLVMS